MKTKQEKPTMTTEEKKRICVNCEKECDGTPCPYCGSGVFKYATPPETTEEKKICQNCAPTPHAAISVTDIYHPHCAHCGRCLDGRCVQLKHDGTVLTPPQTGREWEPRLKEILDGMDITELTHGIGEIVQLIRSLIATARAEERDKTIKKAKSIVLTCYVDEDTREHRIHDDALDLVYSRLEALNGRKV